MSGTADEEGAERARRRRNGFALHLAAYFALIAAVVPVNLFWIAPGTPWFLLPMVGWGASARKGGPSAELRQVAQFCVSGPQARDVHCAFVMGLFERAR